MIKQLTICEYDTLVLVAEGHSNKVIADRMGVSEHTVKFHIGNLRKKLGTPTRAGAAAMYAYEKAYAEGFAAGAAGVTNCKPAVCA